jgi:TonB family protein
VQIPETPVEVIPIGKTPPNTPPPPERTNEPPPKVQAPEKPPEPKPEPKPKPKKKTPTDEQLLAQRMDELQRKKERDAEDEALNQTLANLALERGRGDGSSSTPASTRTQGQRLDPEAERYYLKILEIVRSNWLPPAGLGSSNITATFVIAIDPSGRVTGKNLRISSGNPSFDASVEQAINRSQFPPLPPIFGGKPDNPALQFNFNYLSSG